MRTNATVRKAVTGLLAAGCLWMAGGARAQSSEGLEDIDLFTNPPLAADIPNILLLLDTSANWAATTTATPCTTYADGTPGPAADELGKKVAIEKCALVNVLLSLPVNADGSAKFRIGFMYLNASNADGGYPRKEFLPLTEANRATIVDVIKNTWASSAADQAANADLAHGLWEAYLWYAGLAPFKGKAQTNVSKIKYDNNAFAANGNYISPAATNCGKNYVILMGNGPGNTNEAAIRTKVQDAGGNVTQISYPTSYITTSAQNNWADETARFLKGVDVSSLEEIQNITTYTISVRNTSPSTAQIREYNYIAEIARAGGGTPFSASTVAELEGALNAVFNQIQAGNSVFASASLPVSVNSQGTFLNQVFIGMFRPDGQSRPRWVGNLKQYQFDYDSSNQQVKLVDATGTEAINPTTGFIAPDAVSFWTSATPYTNFWRNMTWTNEPNPGGASDRPDGQLVEKGGAAQVLREWLMTSQASREVYTCIGSACTPPVNSPTNLTQPQQAFKTTNNNITATVLGDAAMSSTDKDTLINWVRGTDNKGDENGPVTVNLSDGTTVNPTVRPQIHGDVLHSSPSVINYGGTTGVVVYYGSNDGTLRAVKGAKTGTNAGRELWAFIPEEFLPKLKRLRNNSPLVQYATTDMDQIPTPQRRDYAMDGPLTFYQRFQSGAVTKAILYAGMRRGGRALYALDVTDPTTPKILWKHTATGALAALGQTWSEARVTRIEGYTNPVIIMGGGYDPAEDTSASPTTTMGNIVVVLDAFTGTVLKVFTGIDRPVPASVAIVDTNNDSKMDRAYAVDLGGNVYRLSFPTAAPADWTSTKIAALGTDATQKMFYAPAVAVTSTQIAIQVGTGDREKPLATNTANRFYMVLDKGQTSAVDRTSLTLMTSAGLSGGVPADSYGCYFNLPNAGEKVVNAVTYTSGTAFFGTNYPTPPNDNSCASNLGVASIYAIPAFCGAVSISELEGGGFPPTAVVGTVLVPRDGTSNCETNPENCQQVPVGIGITPSDCEGNPSTVTSAIGATNIYACPPRQRLRRDWSITNPR